MTTRKMKRLRICVLMLVHPPGRMPPWYASFSVLAHGTSGWTFSAQSSVLCVATSGPGTNLFPVTLAVGTLPLLLFQGVHPVSLSISPRMILESCALKVGSLIGFLMGLVWAGVATPLPLLPLPPLPCPGRLGNMVARMLHLPVRMLRYINVDLMIGQSSRVDNRLYFLLWRLLRQDLFWTEYDWLTLLDAVVESRVVPVGSDCELLFWFEARWFYDWYWKCSGVLVIWEVGQVGVGFREVLLLLTVDLPV